LSAAGVWILISSINYNAEPLHVQNIFYKLFKTINLGSYPDTLEFFSSIRSYKEVKAKYKDMNPGKFNEMMGCLLTDEIIIERLIFFTYSEYPVQEGYIDEAKLSDSEYEALEIIKKMSTNKKSLKQSYPLDSNLIDCILSLSKRSPGQVQFYFV